jgi:hypothetical protein
MVISGFMDVPLRMMRVHRVRSQIGSPIWNQVCAMAYPALTSIDNFAHKIRNSRKNSRDGTLGLCEAQ